MTTVTDEPGVHAASVVHGGVTELFLTAVPRPSDDPATVLRRLGENLHSWADQVLEMRIFGSLDAYSTWERALGELVGTIQWPLTFVQGESCLGGGVAGVQLHAVAGSAVGTLRRDGRVLGRRFETDHAHYCILGDLSSADPRAAREAQARDTMGQMVESLSSAGMGIHDIVRTWFFIDEILAWYPSFNGVRSEIYEKAGVFRAYVPASTGISGSNQHGTAVVASALAMRPKGSGVGVRALSSPLQCPALSYGSSFSRAAELVTPESRTVFVSGTASIGMDGKTMHVDDVGAQIENTLEVVGAILESRGMTFRDVTRGNAYFRRSGDAGRLEGSASRHGLSLSRVVISRNDVCRDDLLFELEVDGVAAGDRR